MLNLIIGYSDKKTIDDFYKRNIDTYAMKYPDFAKRLDQIWKECSAAPKKQTPLAKWLGFAQPTINDWLNGKVLPSLDTAIKLANKFDVCVEWLVTGRGPKHPTDLINNKDCLDLSKLSIENRALVELMYVNLIKGQPLIAYQNEPSQSQKSKDISKANLIFTDMLEKSCEK